MKPNVWAKAPLIAILAVALTSCDNKTDSSTSSADATGGHVELASEVKPGYEKEWDRKWFDHGLWDDVVSTFVNNQGLVNYDGIATSGAFHEYLYRLAKTDAAGLADDRQRLAFWINAYNALTLWAVLDTLPQDRTKWPEYSIKDQRIGGDNLWEGLRFTLGGGTWSLDEIEHEILRKQDGLRDPRIHVALVCGARGCPPLWNRAYTGEAIKVELDAAVRRFVSNPSQCSIDARTGVIRISKVFDWYGGDFRDSRFSPRADSIPAFLSAYVKDAALAKALRSQEWEMEYFDYDWKLNLQG